MLGVIKIPRVFLTLLTCLFQPTLYNKYMKCIQNINNEIGSIKIKVFNPLLRKIVWNVVTKYWQVFFLNNNTYVASVLTFSTISMIFTQHNHHNVFGKHLKPFQHWETTIESSIHCFGLN